MRQRLFNRSTIVLFILLVLLCAMPLSVAGESPLAWRSLSVPGDFVVLDPIAANTPVTIRAQYQFSSEESIDGLEGIWLAGLSVRPDTPPTFLSVVWSEVTAGWFPARGIQLQSDQSLFPSSLPVRRDSGFLAGSEYISLLNHALDVGQALEVQLSYDPRSGAAALNVIDLAEGKSLFSGEYALKPYNGVLYPALGIVTDKPGIKVEYFSAVPYSVPVGTRWSYLIQNPETKRYEQLYLIRILHNSELALQLGTRKHLEGQFELVAEQGDKKQVVLQIPATDETANTTYTFAAKNLPQGPITLNLQYRDPQGNAWLLGASPLDVVLGTIQATFEPMQIQGKELHGALRLTSEDAVVEQVQLRVTAHIKEYGQSESRDVVVLNQPLAQITTSTQIIPYVVPFDVESKFYELTFSVDFGVPVSTILSGDRFHVLW